MPEEHSIPVWDGISNDRECEAQVTRDTFILGPSAQHEGSKIYIIHREGGSRV